MGKLNLQPWLKLLVGKFQSLTTILVRRSMVSSKMYKPLQTPKNMLQHVAT